MKTLSIICAKALIFIGNIFGRGSATPGQVALKIDKNILSKLKMPKTVICVTGSSGKGSTCNLIVDIARKQGKTVVFNNKGSNLVTGILTALLGASNLKGELKQDILVTEIDERYTKLLFKYLKPNYVVITNITRDQPPRHGHFEIVYEEIKKAITKDMHLVLNADDPKQVNYKIKNNCKIIWVGIDSDSADIKASNIKVKETVTTFDVKFYNDDKTYSFETKLLGRHNIYNILSALALGYLFSIPIKDLQTAVKRVKPVEHRLEIKKLGNFYQIDDAYNSNPVGAKGALDVLSGIDGYKIVVTPGMVELGKKEDELNKIFGTQIADVADLVILVGKKKTKPIYEGLLEKKYPEDKIIILNDVRDSYKLINSLNEKKKVYALYENDLPDTYNE